MSFKSFLKFVGCRQNSRPEYLGLIVDVSDVSAVAYSTAGLDEGANYATIFKNGTGDYSIKFNQKGARSPIVMGVVPQLEDIAYKVTVVDNETIRVVTANLSGTDTDADFHISVMQLFKSSQR